MTNKELYEEIICIRNELVEMRKEVKMLSSNNGGAFKPKYGEEYWIIDSDGGVYSEVWESLKFDFDVYSIGNCFPTEEAAKDTVRVLELIQKTRITEYGK